MNSNTCQNLQDPSTFAKICFLCTSSSELPPPQCPPPKKIKISSTSQGEKNMPHLCCGLVFLQVNIAGSQVSRFGAAREEDVAFMIFLPASCGRCFFFGCGM